jgi:curved DNA-binding protein CbpA
MDSHYETLGIAPFSNLVDIKRSFRRLAKRYHPDVPQTGNREKYESVRAAYETLYDRAAREDFDRRLREEMASEANGRSQDIDIETKLEIILAWSTTNRKFDPSVVNSFANQLSKGKNLSTKQLAALENIVRGFDIPLDEWLDEEKRADALEKYFEKYHPFEKFE